MFKRSRGLLVGNFRYIYSSVNSFFLARIRFNVISKDKRKRIILLSSGKVLYNEKALLLSQQGFFFVDKRFDISNLSLIRDITGINKLENVLPLLK